jgi:SAM-dependent methyltransferase
LSRSRPVRILRVTLWGLTAVHLLEALLVRNRREQVPLLEGPADPDHGPVEVASVTADDLDPAVVARAAALIAAGDAQVVDLLPADLDPDRLLRVLRRIDFLRLADDVLYVPGGAHEALVLGEVAAKRTSVPAGPGLGRGRMVRATYEAQRVAPGAHTFRIAPGLRAAPWTPADHWAELRELSAMYRTQVDVPPLLVAAETLHLLALTAGAVIAPVPGLAALATWSAQPVLALGGLPRTADGAPVPPGVGPAAVRRLADRWVRNVRTWAAYAENRPPTHTGHPSPPPLDELFEEPVDACPWCAANDLVPKVDGLDLNQFKPGVFHLDECTRCGHVFQNPQLTVEGLSYYYADVYDGAGEEMLEYGLSTRGKARLYEGRIELLARATDVPPARWLDVGTGHGHFCLAARQRWPGTHFDGLDQSDSVLDARRRGRVDGAHYGQFPELAPQLAGSYDVVSMNHYLEHARDPRAEVAAAATVLAPGGHLLLEGPDAASPWSRLGAYWICWLQPQHLHFITCEGLIAELEKVGFDVVSVERAAASEGGDLIMAASFLAQRLAGHGRVVPWLPPPSILHRLRRAAVLTASVPLIALASIVDGFKEPWQKRPGSETAGNAYRLVARKR